MNQAPSYQVDLVPQSPCSRCRGNNPLDVLRGLAILDMLLVHFSNFFPDIVRKIIVYHDVALDGFILVSGYSMGRFIYARFESHPLQCSKKIFVRAFKIFLINTLLISTVGLAQFFLTSDNVSSIDIVVFLFKTILSINQVGLFHILPVFVILFFISPLMFFLVSKMGALFVFLCSLVLFIIGVHNPLIFNYGESAIFPVIIWQFVFVVGFFGGKMDLLSNKYFANNNVLSLIIFNFVILMSLRHITHFNFFFEEVLRKHNLIYHRFPLNFAAFAYGLSCWMLIASVIVHFWNRLVRFSLISFFSMIGRNALFAFSLHVIIAKIIEIVVKINNDYYIALHFLIISNILLYIFGIPVFEQFVLNRRRCFISCLFD